LNGLQYVSRFWEKPNLVEARALQKSGYLWNTFVMIGSGDAFLGLLGATVPHLLAAMGDWFSAPDLDRIYREIEPIDFSKEVLSAAPERLLVLCDGPSGWTDFGSPQRAMDVLLDVPPFLTQPVKTQNPSTGELSDGVAVGWLEDRGDP
jgi:mannose-1-phosphate guanylyltransferase